MKGDGIKRAIERAAAVEAKAPPQDKAAFWRRLQRERPEEAAYLREVSRIFGRPNIQLGPVRIKGEVWFDGGADV